MLNPFHHLGPVSIEKAAVEQSAAHKQVFNYLRREEYVALLAPRQSGKTTFLARLQSTLQEEKWLDRKVCYLNLQGVRNKKSLIATFQKVPGKTTAESHNTDLKDWLDKLIKAEDPMVFLIDELPGAMPAATLLLASVRAHYNEFRGSGSMHLFVFAGSTDLALLSSRASPYVSPFNIAQEVYLSDFTLEETRAWVQGLVKDDEKGRIFDENTIDGIHKLTCGHPYLTQFLCYRIYDVGDTDARDQILATPEKAIEHCDIEDSVNVQAMIDRLWQADEMDEERQYLRQILLENRPVPFRSSVRALKNLQLQGCIKGQGGQCAIRNPIYKTIFQRRFDSEAILTDAGAQGLASRIRRFVGQTCVEILNGDKHIPPVQDSGSKVFPLHWDRTYQLRVTLLEEDAAEGATDVEIGNALIQPINVQGEESEEQGIEYRVNPESFTVDFSPGEISQTFPARRIGGPICGRFDFHFATPPLDKLTIAGDSGANAERSFRIFLNLYQGIALVHSFEVRLRISA